MVRNNGNVIVIGCQWGDEGKGKIVDLLSERADAVVRFQGGHNAGHTLVIDGEVYKLSLLPSGVVRKNKKSYIGNGVVIDPWALLDEITKVGEQGITVTPANLAIAENAPLLLPLHRQLDQARESMVGTRRIGTTGRGIGPAYEDKVGRRAVRFADLKYPAYLRDLIQHLLRHHQQNLSRTALDGNSADLQQIASEQFDQLMQLAPKLLPFAQPIWRNLAALQQQNKSILFEGAQGIWLDIDHGTYPYVTSSHTVSGQAFSGSGFSHPAFRLGIVKAYTTRVGEGPMPTELADQVGQTLGERGREFGTVTGRKRRCGWFDAALVRQGIQIAGINAIAFTKLDVLDTFAELNIAVGYTIDGKKYDYLPAIAAEQEMAEPIYETVSGWQSDTSGVRELSQLPAAALQYVRRIEQLLGVPVALISTSPERADTINLIDPFSTNPYQVESSVS